MELDFVDMLSKWPLVNVLNRLLRFDILQFYHDGWAYGTYKRKFSNLSLNLDGFCFRSSP